MFHFQIEWLEACQKQIIYFKRDCIYLFRKAIPIWYFWGFGALMVLDFKKKKNYFGFLSGRIL